MSTVQWIGYLVISTAYASLSHMHSDGVYHPQHAILNVSGAFLVFWEVKSVNAIEDRKAQLCQGGRTCAEEDDAVESSTKLQTSAGVYYLSP